MISAYEHGQNAAQHGKHIQACPFDLGTVQWREWCDGFMWLTAGDTGVTRGGIIVLRGGACAVERAANPLHRAPVDDHHSRNTLPGYSGRGVAGAFRVQPLPFTSVIRRQTQRSKMVASTPGGKPCSQGRNSHADGPG
jgi:hypothetical protein